MDQGQIPSSAATVEQAMRDELAEGNGALVATRPILAMLLTNRDQSLFSDEVIARVRGMIAHVAQQVLLACGEAGGQRDPAALLDQAHESLTQMLLGDAAILSHAHALTQEFALSEQLHRRSGIDGVLSPLLQELAASSDADLAASAMRVIAAQARFLQSLADKASPVVVAESPASAGPAAVPASTPVETLPAMDGAADRGRLRAEARRALAARRSE